jgi:uncharacterized protein YaiL (DUF2058 family)
LRARINGGELLIARHGGFYALVPKELGERIRERDAEMIVELRSAEAAVPAEDDPYKDFVVPDDLTW